MRLGLAVSVAILIGAGCAHADPRPPSKPLPRGVVEIDGANGPVRFDVEIAGDRDSQAYGLMNRKSLAPNAGMLFDFHVPVMTSFWMKDTLIPLDMIFITPKGTVSSVAPDAIPMSEDTISSVEPIRAVLEIKGGRAAQLGIYPGEKVHNAIFNKH